MRRVVLPSPTPSADSGSGRDAVDTDISGPTTVADVGASSAASDGWCPRGQRRRIPAADAADAETQSAAPERPAMASRRALCPGFLSLFGLGGSGVLMEFITAALASPIRREITRLLANRAVWPSPHVIAETVPGHGDGVRPTPPIPKPVVVVHGGRRAGGRLSLGRGGRLVHLGVADELAPPAARDSCGGGARHRDFNLFAGPVTTLAPVTVGEVVSGNRVRTGGLLGGSGGAAAAAVAKPGRRR